MKRTPYILLTFILFLSQLSLFVNGETIEYKKYVILAKDTEQNGVKALTSKSDYWEVNSFKHIQWLDHVKDMHINDEYAYFLNNNPSERGIYQLKSEKPNSIKKLTLMTAIETEIEDGLFCYFNATGFVIGKSTNNLYRIKNVGGVTSYGEINLPFEPKRLACLEDTNLFVGTENGIYYVDIRSSTPSIQHLIMTTGWDIKTLQIYDQRLLFSYHGAREIYRISANYPVPLDTVPIVFMNVPQEDFSFFYRYDLLITHDNTGITFYELDVEDKIYMTLTYIPYLSGEFIVFAYLPPAKLAVWVLVIIIIIPNLPIIGFIIYVLVMLFYLCGKFVLVPLFSCCCKGVTGRTTRTTQTTQTTQTAQTTLTTQTTQMDDYSIQMNNLFGSEQSMDEEERIINEERMMGRVNTDFSSSSEDNSDDICVECRTVKVFAIIIPCEHECLCLDCGEKYRNEKRACPVCHTEIETVWPK